jgi:BlaI family transcriptional regulator, penicillinase repressor
MARSTREVPPPLELLCLRALWTLGEGGVRAVQGIVTASRPLAYTTIMTVMDRLLRKGIVTRRKAGKSYIYAPQTSLETMRRAAVRELLEGYFDGSEEHLIRFLRGEDSRPAARLEERAESIDTVLL